MLQERIEKMEKELAKLKELAKSGIFKVGCYFKHSQYGKSNLMKVGNPEVHKDKIYKLKRFDSRKNCSGDYNLISECNYEVAPMWVELATPSEIESHLLQEAEKKGFVKGAKVTYSKHAGSEEIDYLFIQCTTHRLAKCPPKDYSNCDVAIQLKNNGWAFLSECELLPSCPQITVGGHKVEFKIDHIVVGCTEVRVSTIKEILKHYETK